MKRFSRELPDLTGSEKQINWATKIRYVKLTGIHSDFWDKNITNASFWIEHRNRLKPPRN